MNTTNRRVNQVVSSCVEHEVAEIEKLNITENGEWGRSFLDGVKLAVPDAAILSATTSTPTYLSLLDELNSLDRAA